MQTLISVTLLFVSITAVTYDAAFILLCFRIITPLIDKV
ncbi:hypothetical protein C7449_101378 [Mycoplana dimorpha]|uniref:Uncharacterized protein n=1 Tax=Mycoplana dimorpha TaxID=28320 RepID=A0A2T5BIA8_MYCDI|nr:hypothetical protein C7449_101378 [Mycoplana dimorpha]